MNERPDLDIIIPQYGGADLLWRCLTHLWCFAPQKTRIVIVDDCCPDPNTATIGEFCARTGRAVYHRHETNQGFSAACNTGLRLTQSNAAPAVIFLNNDAAVLPDTLHLLLYALKNTGHKIVCAERKQGEDGNGNDPSHYVRSEPVTNVTLVPNYTFLCTAVDRQLMDELGGLWADCKQHFSDVDFALRARAIGYDPILVKEAMVYHGAGMSAKRMGARKMSEDYLRDRAAFYERWKDAAPAMFGPEVGQINMDHTVEYLTEMNDEVWKHAGEPA